MRYVQHITRRCAWLFLLTVLAVLSASAQEAPVYTVHPGYTLQQWTTRDGLPNNTINDLLLASNGYLWLATNEGLVRFDGAHFTVFNTTNTSHLPGNRYNSLFEEPQGYLWARSEKADLVLYQNGHFTRFEEKIARDYWRNGIPLLTYGGSDSLLVGTWSGLTRYTEGRLEPYLREVIEGRVLSMNLDARGQLWVFVMNQGLYRIERDGTVQLFAAEDGFNFGGGNQLMIDGADRVWTKTSVGIIRIDGDQVEIIHSGDGLNLEYKDADGGIWLSSPTEGWWHHAPSGTSILVPLPNAASMAEDLIEGPRTLQGQAESAIRLVHLPATNERTLYQDETAILGGINDEVTKLLVDRRDNLWIGTRFGGLFRIRHSFLHTLSEADGLPTNAIYPILEDRNGASWIGTLGGGLVRFDTKNHPTVFEPDGTIPQYVFALHEDPAGDIWVGGIESVCRMRANQCEASGLTIKTAVRAVLEDQQRRVWVGGENDGLFVGHPRDGTLSWTRVQSDDGLPQSWVRVITETHDGAILLGTNGDGVLRYDNNGGFDVLSTEQGLPSNLVRDIYEDSDRMLWIALEDQGLCRLDRREQPSLAAGDLRCLNSRNGLYQSGLHRIIEDDYGRFWFNTNNGIFWVRHAMLNAFLNGEIQSVTSVSYTEADGMRHREGNGGMQPAGVKARDGRLWFPTQGGVVIVDPSEVPLPEAPQVRLEEVQVGEEARPAMGSLDLRAEERDVAFRYAALEFNRPEDVRFQYWLEGYDATWRDGGTERFAAYTNLSPGNYTFHVRAGIGGIWSEAANLSIERAPHFWETTWFLALLGLLFVSVGPVVYTYRVRRLKVREAELEDMVAERTTQIREHQTQLEEQAEELRRANELKSRFLANISHEFRTPLTLTFGPLDDIANRRFSSFEEAIPHAERARRNGGRLLRLINQLLDLSKLDAGALLLHPRRFDLGQHLRQITALFESMALAKGLHLSTEIPEEPHLHVYDADKIEKVIINLLSNAFKFTPEDGKVSLTLNSEAEGVTRIVVADTGPGIAKEDLPHLFDRFYQVESAATRAHEGSGIGLSLVKELVELHEGTVSVESTLGFGTRFTIRLPLLQEEAPEEVPQEHVAVPEAKVEETILLGLTNGDRIDKPSRQEQAIDEEETVVLVVEDNIDMRAYIRAQLEDEFTVVEAENGKVGVEQACDLVPDLVLSDVMMPEIDGLEACAAIKADERTSHIPVVLLTARADVDHRIEGFESGADAYLPKPFNAHELQVRVRTLIEERRRLRARFAGSLRAEAPEEERPVLPKREAAFLEKVYQVIESRLGEPHFGVDVLAEELLMSRRQLLRKLRALTDETPTTLIRRLRLARAAELLGAGETSIKEVCYAVGFQSSSSFTRAFRQAYGVSPSVYAQQNGTS